MTDRKPNAGKGSPDRTGHYRDALAAALAATDAARSENATRFGLGEIDMDEFLRRLVEITHRERRALQDADAAAAALLRKWEQ